MSKIVKFGPDKTEQVRRKVSNVHCLWKMGELDDGKPCVIMSMVNPDAKSGAVSQSLHITADVAKKMIDIFERELLNK